MCITTFRHKINQAYYFDGFNAMAIEGLRRRGNFLCVFGLLHRSALRKVLARNVTTFEVIVVNPKSNGSPVSKDL